MKVLVIDAGVKKITADWKYDVVSIGFPGPVLRNRPLADRSKQPEAKQ